jgi:hypothetical protein
MCVQRFDDSRRYAIRITYRISLRSSSLWEPRHPLLKVVWHLRHMRRGRKNVFKVFLPHLLFVRLMFIILFFLVLWLITTTPKGRYKRVIHNMYNFTVIDLGDLGI